MHDLFTIPCSCIQIVLLLLERDGQNSQEVFGRDRHEREGHF